MKVALATLKTLGFEQDFLGDKNVLQNTFILIELEGRIPMQAYNAWMIEKDALKASGTIPNLENLTNFYEKMSNQQLDAMYIRKQLEDLNRSNDANTTPGERKQGGGPKDTPSKKRGKDSINLLAKKQCMRGKRMKKVLQQDLNLLKEILRSNIVHSKSVLDMQQPSVSLEQSTPRQK